MSSLAERLRARIETKTVVVDTKPAVSETTVSLSARLVEKHGIPEGKGSKKFAEAYARGGVPKSFETDRVFALPRRKWTSPEMSEAARILTAQFRVPGGTDDLRPLQAVALVEASECNGLFAPLAVGLGKTLVCLLLPEIMQARCAVILVAPQLRDQLLNHDIARYSKHFRIDMSRIHVVAYSTLSIESGAEELEKLNPDLIIADEAHNVRNRTATRTKRFLRYFKAHPDTRFCALSGTMTTRSLRDYAHLTELALRKNSPLPCDYRVLNDWADAIDAPEDELFQGMQPGVLTELCKENESLRSGFRRRLVETAGVVATSEENLGVSLSIFKREIVIPDLVNVALSGLRKTWCRPDGEELQDVLEYARVARQIAAGFYYRWVWPGGEPDYEWLEARANWHRWVRDFLQRRAKPGIDSPMLVARAVKEGKIDSPFWNAWEAVKDRPEPPTEAVWINDFLPRNAGALAVPTIVWYEHDAVGHKISELYPEYPLIDGGEDAALGKLATRSDPPSIIASIKAHGHGKNLQAWSRMLFTSCPGSGTVWEQALGRCHRQGQKADEVEAYVYLQTKEVYASWNRAKKDAEYVEETTGSKQKLNYANKGDRLWDYSQE